MRELIAQYPQAHRRRLSQLLCAAWDWRNERGQLKDMAARNLMLKLHQRGQISLPPPRRPPTNAQRGLKPHPVPPAGPVLETNLSSLRPIRLELIIPGGLHASLFQGLLAHYHYLGFRGPTGENLLYLAWSARAQPLACMVFEAAAWKVAARDRCLGWEQTSRPARLRSITNQSRFLVLPWIRVPHLASYLLSLAARQLRTDWPRKYGHPVELIESFVDTERFAATCYRAANWIYLGLTQGRSRNDRDRTRRVPRKALYVYPLRASWRQRLKLRRTDG